MTNIFIKAPEPKIYGSFIERRNPQSKVHSKLAHAKSAIGVKWPHCGGIIYQNIDGEWKEIFRIDTPTKCAKCGEGFKTYYDKRVTNYNVPKLERPVVCYSCYSKHWGHNAPERLPIDWKPDVQL